MACARAFFPTPWSPGADQKVKYHLISITEPILKIFIPNFVCVLTNERYINTSDGIFIMLPGSCTKGGTLGGLGVSRGSIMVMWHIKLTGMTSRTKCN